MSKMIANVVLFVVSAMAVVFVLFVLYGMFVYVPVSMYAEAECLRNGYPRAHVTIGLERYCSTLDGAVTVKVEKQGRE